MCTKYARRSERQVGMSGRMEKGGWRPGEGGDGYWPYPYPQPPPPATRDENRPGWAAGLYSREPYAPEVAPPMARMAPGAIQGTRIGTYYPIVPQEEVIADVDKEAQMESIDPTQEPEQLAEQLQQIMFPYQWVYAPRLGTEDGCICFFIEAPPNARIVKFNQGKNFEFTGGVYYPLPAAFDVIQLTDVDYSSGESVVFARFKLKIKEGPGTAATIRMQGKVRSDSPVMDLEWYEVVNERSSIMMPVMPRKPMYQITDYEKPFANVGTRGTAGESFLNNTAIVANTRALQMEPTTFLLSQKDEKDRAKRIASGRRMWAAFRDDLARRSAFITYQIEQNHAYVANYFSGRGEEVHHFPGVNVNVAAQ